MVTAQAGEGTSWAAEAGRFELGPVPSALDLRNMLTRHIVRRSCELLDAVAARRKAAFENGDWQAWRDGVRKAVRDALGPLPFGKEGGPLNVRVVSRHERPGYVVENVLFESLPGLDVNGSVYLPLTETYPPPWPAIVVPVGHSTKTGADYQIPAQVFARLGYVAITFDPPGMAGEKSIGNDHFNDGVRCYLTGHSSNRYFVIDALRCIDYLAARPDVDLSNGVGMTGVSGGGMTTMFAALLDDRIRAAGPSCCAVPNAMHPVLDDYAPCPETLASERFAAYDDMDLLAAAMPTPVLLMAGAKDEVFREDMSRAIASDVEQSFVKAGHGDRFAFFLDSSGHAYTVPMAVEFVRWMDRWVRGALNRPLPELTPGDFEVAPKEILMCHPRLDRNMFSINRDMALAMGEHGSGLSVQDAARIVVHVDEAVQPPVAREGKPALSWFHHVQELVLQPDSDIELPATFSYPAEPRWKGAALLYFDERGRWTDLRTNGWLAELTRFLDAATDGPAVLTVDLRGWGDTRPADLNYDIAGWGCRERWCGYVSAAMGDAVLAMRIRDGLAALAYLRTRQEVDAARIVVGGRGMGGVVALHVAAIDAQVAGVFSMDALACFESLATEESHGYPHDAFLPGVLPHYDLPEMAAAINVPTLVLNPLGARKEPLTQAAAEALYDDAIANREGFRLRTGGDAKDVVAFVRETLQP